MMLITSRKKEVLQERLTTSSLKSVSNLLLLLVRVSVLSCLGCDSVFMTQARIRKSPTYILGSITLAIVAGVELIKFNNLSAAAAGSTRYSDVSKIVNPLEHLAWCTHKTNEALIICRVSHGRALN